MDFVLEIILTLLGEIFGEKISKYFRQLIRSLFPNLTQNKKTRRVLDTVLLIYLILSVASILLGISLLFSDAPNIVALCLIFIPIILFTALMLLAKLLLHMRNRK